MPKQSSGQKRKVKKVMHEYKHGDLKSGKQAIAVAMHEAGVPKKRGEKKKNLSKAKPGPKKGSKRKKS